MIMKTKEECKLRKNAFGMYIYSTEMQISVHFDNKLILNIMVVFKIILVIRLQKANDLSSLL
jgi:hypothetical protein